MRSDAALSASKQLLKNSLYQDGLYRLFLTNNDKELSLLK